LLLPAAQTEPHGTFVAGIIGAAGNNKMGIAGVAWNIRLMPVRFIGNDGTGLTSRAIQCMDFALANGAHIINNSWGNRSSAATNQLLREAHQRAEAAGVLVVCSAGNENEDTDVAPHFPSEFNTTLTNVISVGGSDDKDAHGTSNFGLTSVDLHAPGEKVLCTVPASLGIGPFGLATGTSGSAPFVTGVAALLKSVSPAMSPAELRARILANVDVVPGLVGRNATSGRLNANRALFNGNIPSGTFKAPANVKFNAVKIGSFLEKDLVLSNTDTLESLQVTVGVPTAPFSIVSGGGTAILAPKGKHTVRVRFTPTVKDTAEQLLSFTSSDFFAPTDTVLLNGKGKL
jgi:subtilisin family serine protease